MDWLSAPLPDGTVPVTFTVGEPFATSFNVAFYAAVALSIPSSSGRPGRSLPRPSRSAARRWSRAGHRGDAPAPLGMASHRVVLPNAVPFLLNFDRSNMTRWFGRATYYSFAAITILGCGVPSSCRSSSSASYASASSPRRSCAATAGSASASASSPWCSCPASTSSRWRFRRPRSSLFESSIWAAAFFERRWSQAGVLPEPLTGTATVDVPQDRAPRPSRGDGSAGDAARDRAPKRPPAARRHRRGPGRALRVPRLRALHRGLDPDDERAPDADDFRQVVVDYAAEAARHGAVYVEAIFSPAERIARGVAVGQDLRGLLRRQRRRQRSATASPSASRRTSTAARPGSRPRRLSALRR